MYSQMEYAGDDIQHQFNLLFAFILIQLGGWTHPHAAERRITDG